MWELLSMWITSNQIDSKKIETEKDFDTYYFVFISYKSWEYVIAYIYHIVGKKKQTEENTNNFIPTVRPNRNNIYSSSHGSKMWNEVVLNAECLYACIRGEAKNAKSAWQLSPWH